MKMIRQEAKDLSIKLWKCLSETGIDLKINTPLYKEIKNLRNECPLCELYFDHLADGKKIRICSKECPLSQNYTYMKSCYSCANGFYKKWMYAKTTEEKKNYAKEILSLIESWNIK